MRQETILFSIVAFVLAAVGGFTVIAVIRNPAKPLPVPAPPSMDDAREAVRDVQAQSTEYWEDFSVQTDAPGKYS
jgi:hypothetical protein